MSGSDPDFFGTFDAGPEFGTPPWLWKPLDDAVGGFDLDPASGAEPSPIADERFTVEENGLEQKWFGDVWVNPPYGRDFNSDWANKIAREAKRPQVDTITALVPASTSTKWFQENYTEANYLTFINGRIKFLEPDSNDRDSASFASVVCSFGSFSDDYLTSLNKFGFLAEPSSFETGTSLRTSQLRKGQDQFE